MVIGEMVPKNLAIAAPERTLLALSGLEPDLRRRLPSGHPGAQRAWPTPRMRLLGVEPRDERAIAHTAEELARLLAESRGAASSTTPPTT